VASVADSNHSNFSLISANVEAWKTITQCRLPFITEPKCEMDPVDSTEDKKCLRDLILVSIVVIVGFLAPFI